MFDGTFRKPVDKAVKPIGAFLRKTKLTPDHLTVLGLLVGVGAAVAIGFGRLWLGLALVILAGLPDLLDGALAKATGTSSQRGAFRLDRRSSSGAVAFCCCLHFIDHQLPAG
jgi:CDP-diacylglycerol--glycerol-3-phosphate 3-phosphatidyltransferase